ncbi:hypothetical protein DFH06DRAFT_1136365 [Mycena polygramma]|nr:hypothetical protein DFH06DRAFT_1136365 [Mycena polygramma]
MSYIRLALCVAGVFSMFLVRAISWILKVAIGHHKVVGDTGPHQTSSNPPYSWAQSRAPSAPSPRLYIYSSGVNRRKPTDTFMQSLGLEHAPEPVPAATANGHAAKHPAKPSTRFSRSALLLGYIQCSLFLAATAPFGFATLSYISYPAMVLGKTCKLVP